MTSSTFIKLTGIFFSQWLTYIDKKLKNGELQIHGNYSFPTFVRVGQSRSHFMAELMGAIDEITENYKLKIPRSPEKFPNALSFVNPGFRVLGEMGEDAATINLRGSSDYVISNVTITTPYDLKLFKKKIDLSINPTEVKAGFDAKIPIYIDASSNKGVFRHLAFIRADDWRIFFKSISTAIIVRKDMDEFEYEKWLTKKAVELLNCTLPARDIFGLNIGYSTTTETFARELLSLVSQQVDEKVIDSFINNHSHYFSSALGYKKAIKVKLKVVDKERLDRDSLIPDYLMLRPDGYYDILDLKRALLKYKSLTKGGKSRIRFNDYVAELVAQLVGYDRYFKSKRNRDWALREVGVKVRNPQLFGIVGDYSNYIQEDVDLVLQQYKYKKRITIMSYSDLIGLLKWTSR